MMSQEPKKNMEHTELWTEYWSDRESEQAKAALVEAWLPFVRTVLDRVAIQLPSHVAVDDLFQVAVIGLLGSIERYDDSFGVSFKGFASRRIRGAILDELRSTDHLSRTKRSQVKRVEATIQAFTNEHGTPPTEQELADAMDMSVEQVSALLDKSSPWLSLDQVVMANNSGKEVFLRDILADPESPSPDMEAIHEDVKAYLRESFRRLSTREQKILHLYYFEDLRLNEIAVLFEVTEARVCQIHALAIAKLKAMMSSYDYNSAGHSV